MLLSQQLRSEIFFVPMIITDILNIASAGPNPKNHPSISEKFLGNVSPQWTTCKFDQYKTDFLIILKVVNWFIINLSFDFIVKWALRCSHHKIFKVCLAILQHYA